MNSKKSTLIILFLLTLLGGLLRFYKLTENPVSLNPDEVSFAYSAYSVLKTGKDEYGKFLPITFKSVGDYKNPVPVYSLVLSEAVFGLNDFGERFPFAFFGTLAIPVLFFLAFQLTKNKNIAFLAAGMLVISPWHVFYSRYGNDPPMGMVVASLGLLFFLKMIEKRGIYTILAAFFLVLSMYSYYSERVFIPLLFLLLITLFFGNLKKHLKSTIVFLTASAIFVSLLVLRSFFGPDLARGNMVFIAKDVDYLRYIALDHVSPGLNLGGIHIEETFALLTLVVGRYLNYLQPDFLFFTGLNMTHEGSLGLGVLYLFDLPLLILGILELIKGKFPNRGLNTKYQVPLIFGWIALSFIPAALTNNEHNAGRTIQALPMVLLISAIGFTKFIEFIRKMKQVYIKTAAVLFCGLFVLISLIHALITYSVHFPVDRSEFSMKGNKEAVEYILANKEKYQEVVFDPFRGVDAPAIYSLPGYYILFYAKYDPALYQKELIENEKKGISGFGQYRIRKIYWPNDRYAKDTLFVGSPWSLPLKDIKEEEILKRIYLSNGQLALLVVNPKPPK
ncbi:glycosyltransferase family 39 protein [Candidatus Daviesbacteria bacterium]|nr:glycosyltransferase family 39 protein [Candidatus Daviesbacteria bacterium]